LLIIDTSYLRGDPDLDQDTVTLIIKKYAGYYISIGKIEGLRIDQNIFYENLISLNTSRKRIIELFISRYNIKYRQASRIVTTLSKGLKD
jgi:hypothetical protein